MLSSYGVFHFLALIFSSFAVTISASCSGFTLSNNYSSAYPTSDLYRISTGFTCKNGLSIGANPSSLCISPNCSFGPPASTLTVTGFTNLSLSSDDTQSLFNTVASALGTSIPYSQTGKVEATFSFCVANGASGYATLNPGTICYVGVVGDCSNGPVASNTSVTLCSPIPPDNGDIGGLVAFMNTTAAVAANLTSLPDYSAATRPLDARGLCWLIGTTYAIILVMFFI